jgi:beta-lactamase regulating signal transducer with metallopeptidase domain/HEAT repeat protein
MLSNTSMLMLLAKATLILLTALGITVVMQRASAGARHLVWLVTLGTLLVVPAIARWAPLRLEVLPSVEAPAAAAITPDINSAPVAPSPAPEAAAAPVASYSSAGSESILDSIAGLRGFSLVLVIWMTVVAMLLAWLAWSALAVRRIVSNSHPLDTQDWLVPLWEIADRLELEEPPRLLASSDARMPFACGFLKPTIVLPTSSEAWSLDRRRAVLLHELAHVKRRDLVGHTLGRLTCAVYWFHPLVWTAAKQLRSESERACDDLALSCGAKASDYAEHLLDIVTSVKGDATPAVAMAMARRKEFEGRMLAILDPDLRHSTPNRRQSAALIATLAGIAMVVGAAAPAPRASAIVVTSSVPSSQAIAPDFVPSDKAKEPSKVAERPAEIGSKVAKPLPEARPSHKAVAAASADAEAEAEAEAEGMVERAVEAAGLKMENLAKVAPDERPALLANILRTDKDPALRKIAAWGLSEHASAQVAVEALAHALRRDSDAGVREMAAWALSDCRRNSIGVTALMETLRSESDLKLRTTAAWALGQVGDEDAIEVLLPLLSDPNKGIRARAVWAIGQIGPRRAPPALVAVLKDQQPMMRQLAAWALYEIEDPSAAGALQAALNVETVPELKINYIQALAALGEKSVDAVRGLLLSPDPKIKQMAVRALAGGNGAGPWPWPWPEPRPYP